jgi:hypothetical protein
MSDLEEEFVEEAQGASKGASKGASAKKRGSKAEVLEAEAPKRARTELEFFNEEFFPRGWKGSGVDNTFGPTEDCVVYTSIWQVSNENQKLARGLTFIVHSNDGTSTEVMVLAVYKHISSSRMFAVCTDRPNNGTAAEWASPDICSAPRLLKVDLVRPSSPFRGKFPFSTLELQAFMTNHFTARESFKYRTFWSSAVAPNAAKPHKKPPKKPRVEVISDEQPSTDDDLLPVPGTLQTRGNKFGITPAAFDHLLDSKISSALSSSNHAHIAQAVRANAVAETRANMETEIQRANKEAENKRANMEVEVQRARLELDFQRAKMEAEMQSASARATAEHERERRVEQSRLREAEEERNRKERERAQEQLAYDRGQLAEARKLLEADTLYLKQALNQQQSVQAATLGIAMSSNYYQAGAYQPMPGAHPQTQALGSFAQASAAPQPLLAHASEEPAQLRLTDVPNVPGVLVAPLPDVLTWLLHQRIVAKADEVDLEKLSGFGVVDGPDILCLSGEELANVGFKPLAVRKLLNLKAKELEKAL